VQGCVLADARCLHCRRAGNIQPGRIERLVARAPRCFLPLVAAVVGSIVVMATDGSLTGGISADAEGVGRGGLDRSLANPPPWLKPARPWLRRLGGHRCSTASDLPPMDGTSVSAAVSSFGEHLKQQVQ